MAKNYNVFKNDDGWSVKGQGNERVSAKTQTQEEAIKIGKSLAQKSQGELSVHGVNGKIREKNSYGDDPRQIKG